ncbi:MAG: hypothetical protein IJY61_04960 [Candidatus Gastranaerophilales bacterium]|nr:hypothetical protein [Candidatus Gastranaerophilales bacterium]
MNISPVNSNNTNFGKISWGTQDKAEKTAAALVKLKETNDLNNNNRLKYTDVAEQFEILAKHPDTFEVTCHIIEGQADTSFDIHVRDAETDKPLANYSEYFITAYSSRPTKSVKNFANEVLKRHQTKSITKSINDFMARIGQIKK